MARKIAKIPNRMEFGILKLLNYTITIVLFLFCIVSGQTQKSQENGNSAKSIIGASISLFQEVAPDYGVTPLYGVIPVEYGVIYTEYIVNGNILSNSNEKAIENIKVTLRDTTNDFVADSTYSDPKGAFELSYSGDATSNTWCVRVEDIDGEKTGIFEKKDTIITVPLLVSDPPVISKAKIAESNAAQAQTIMGEAFIDIYMNEMNTEIEMVKKGQLSLDFELNSHKVIKQSAIINYKLPSPEYVTLKVYNSSGELVEILVSSLEEAGAHTVTWNASRFSSGAYYFKLNVGKYVLVKKGIVSK